MGVGLDLPNAINIQLDCPSTLTSLTRFGGYISPGRLCVSHWSGYTRPGAMRFYAHALRQPDAVPLPDLLAALPRTTSPRWSGLFARPRLIRTMSPLQKAAL